MSVNVDILNIVLVVLNILVYWTWTCTCTYTAHINLDDDDFVHFEDVFTPSIVLYLRKHIFYVLFILCSAVFFFLFSFFGIFHCCCLLVVATVTVTATAATIRTAVATAFRSSFDLRTKMKYEENIMLHQNVNNANFIDLFVVFVCRGAKL